MTLRAEIAAGPSAPATFDGTLEFTLDSDGMLTNAVFSQGSDRFPVSGVAAGRAVDLQIELGAGEVLILSGVAGEPLVDCPTAAAGLASGPQPGDLGGWQASGSNTGGTIAPALTGTGSSGSTGQSSLSCPPPQTVCGQNCCPGGASCTDANQGLCACPSGAEQCKSNCVPSCTDGQPLDLDTCTCPAPEAECIPNQQTCQNHGQCCSGYCGGGTCFDCVGKVCGEFGCIDPSRDSQNCGNCGTVCVAPQVCNNGVCGCASDGTACTLDTECCSQVCYASNTCETCSNVMSSGPGAPSAPMTFCGPGICADLRIDINNCGACFRVCPAPLGSAVCDAGVCHDINNDADYCGFAAEVCGPGKICRFGDCVAG